MTRSWINHILAVMLRLSFHLMGVMALAAVMWLVVAGSSRLQMVWDAREYGADSLAPALLLHVGIAALIWAGLCLFVSWGRRLKDQPPPVRLSAAGRGGSVYIETLVVLPVAMLLFFGMVQLAIVNMAGVLTNLATFQASRTAWLWEAEGDRSNLTQRELEERVRVQAAAVLTPVVPGTFYQTSRDLPPFATGARDMRGALVGSQSTNAGGDLASRGRQRADSIAILGDAYNAGLATGVDIDNFTERTVRKFTMAYHAVDVQVDSDDDRVGIRLVYDHQCVFPIVCGIFGEPRQLSGMDFGGYYTRFERQWTRQGQVQASERWPGDGG